MEDKILKKDFSVLLNNESYCLGVGLRMFYEDDVPFIELYSKDFLNVHETGVKVPVESLINWISTNVSGAKNFKRTFVK